MSFSSPQTSGSPNFGQRLEQYIGHKNPLVGGLLEQVFGHPQADPQMTGMGANVGAAVEPRFGTQADHPIPVPDQSQPQAPPPQYQDPFHHGGSGAMALLKLLGGA